ncbi:MAG: LVIVD repeat-containing protein, partial [Terriglobia bacterium]
MSHKSQGVFSIVTFSVLLLASCTSNNPTSADSTAADPMSDGAQNVRLVGHNDLQGRTALVVSTKSDPQNGNWVYVGHHESFHDGKPLLNPITGKMEFNGTSILEISDPSKPRLVWHIPNETNRNSRGVFVVYDYQHDGSGRDYLIRNSEDLTQGETGTDLKYQIFDITERSTDPSKITLVSEITGTPPNSCGPGCGGPFKLRAHKGWWSQETGYFYAASGEPGFRNVIIQIFDLKNPKQPKLLGRAWIPGLKEGEPGYEGQYSHHPVVDEENKRLYVGYRNAGGQAASFDISDPTRPKLVWEIDMNPPHRGPHTVSPIVYTSVPNFGASALPRTYAFIVDEAGAPDIKPCPNGVRSASYMVDITTETKPFPVSVWQ